MAFLDCSYYNDVKTEKEKYEQPSICLVAEDDGKMVGFIDVELDSADLTCNGSERGAIVWNLGVLPEYRKNGVAAQLWNTAKQQLAGLGIHYCELWTQEDIPANRFYLSQGFQLEESQTWIRCYAEGKNCRVLLDGDKVGKIYGPEELVFDAAIERKEELKTLCHRIDEVRLYSIRY